jgi:hypothetical protein
MNKLLSTTLVSVSLAAMTASAAMAQTPSPATPPSAFAHAHRFLERPFSRPTERAEARLAYVKTALKITDAQRPQWDGYAAFVRSYARDMEQRFQSRRSAEAKFPRHQRPNAIERLEITQSFLANAVTRINQLLVVEKPLYAALSPEQRQVADTVLKPHFRPMRGHARGGFERG